MELMKGRLVSNALWFQNQTYVTLLSAMLQLGFCYGVVTCTWRWCIAIFGWTHKRTELVFGVMVTTAVGYLVNMVRWWSGSAHGKGDFAPEEGCWT